METELMGKERVGEKSAGLKSDDCMVCTDCLR